MRDITTRIRTLPASARLDARFAQLELIQEVMERTQSELVEKTKVADCIRTATREALRNAGYNYQLIADYTKRAVRGLEWDIDILTRRINDAHMSSTRIISALEQGEYDAHLANRGE